MIKKTQPTSIVDNTLPLCKKSYQPLTISANYRSFYITAVQYTLTSCQRLRLPFLLKTKITQIVLRTERCFSSTNLPHNNTQSIAHVLHTKPPKFLFLFFVGIFYFLFVFPSNEFSTLKTWVNILRVDIQDGSAARST